MNNHIIISNQKNFNLKLSQLEKAGLESLSIISDFDRTLTYAKNKNGESAHTSFSLIRNTGYLPALAIKQLNEYFLEYGPHENDPYLDDQTKTELMTQWWSKVFDVYIQQSIKKQFIYQIVEKHGLALRSGHIELLDKLKFHQVPLLIFSAGMGEVIDHYLNYNKLNFANINLISNFFTYNNENQIIGYHQPIIHSLNKTTDTAENTIYYKKVAAKKNIILLGDSFHDPHMAKDINHDCILRIGFLNSKEDQFLDMYKDLYDVVILKDQGLEYVVQLINQLG